jgi:hypothetical protein
MKRLPARTAPVVILRRQVSTARGSRRRRFLRQALAEGEPVRILHHSAQRHESWGTQRLACVSVIARSVEGTPGRPAIRPLRMLAERGQDWAMESAGADLGIAARRGDCADGGGDQQPSQPRLPHADLPRRGRQEREEPRHVRRRGGRKRGGLPGGRGLLVGQGVGCFDDEIDAARAHRVAAGRGVRPFELPVGSLTGQSRE